MSKDQEEGFSASTSEAVIDHLHKTAEEYRGRRKLLRRQREQAIRTLTGKHHEEWMKTRRTMEDALRGRVRVELEVVNYRLPSILISCITTGRGLYCYQTAQREADKLVKLLYREEYNQILSDIRVKKALR